MSQIRRVEQQPDGDFVTPKSDGVASTTSTPLAAGATYTSPWIDTDGWAAGQLFISADVVSAAQGIEIQYTNDTGAPTPAVYKTVKAEFCATCLRAGSVDIPIFLSQDGVRIRYTNGPMAQTAVLIEVTLRKNTQPSRFGPANTLLTRDFSREAALGRVPGQDDNLKFGAVLDVDTVDPPCTLVATGGATPSLYTGQDATGNENIEVFSSNANDTGSVVASGTLTARGETTVVDSAATFVTSGVAAGDIFLNDTYGTHGIITSVDSETQVTVFEMVDGDNGLYMNDTGDSYRIATATGTGAAVVSLENIVDSGFNKQTTRFVVLNGTSGVTVSVNAYRCSRGKVLLAGAASPASTAGAIGNITARQATTTSVVFFILPAGNNQTLNLADTVPTGKVFLITLLDVSMVRVNGSPGSARIALKVRRFGEVFRGIRNRDISDSQPYKITAAGGILLLPGTDYRVDIMSVSDNNTQISGEFEIEVISR